MEKTNFEYMSEPARVNRAVKGFMQMKLREFRAIQLKNRDFVTLCVRDAIKFEGLDEEKVQEMPYLTLACLFDNMGNDETYGYICSYDNTPYSCKAFKQCVIKIWNTLLLDVYRKSTTVRLFTSLPVNAFYSCMNRFASGKKPVQDGLLREYAYVRQYCTDLGKTVRVKPVDMDKATIKDVLQLCNTVLNSPWLPTEMAVQTYQKNLLCAHCILEKVLVKSFKQVFPREFQMDKVYDVYGLEFEETNNCCKNIGKGE